jgi:protein-tyrosine phosphatase
MKTLLIALLFGSSLSFANDGLTIPNSFKVDAAGHVYRGKEPKAQVEELKSIGITDVIIFKNDVKGEVAQEINDLKKLGITPHHIPFQWKDFPSMQAACEQVIDALTIIESVKAKNDKVYFHCTAGEDRTGTLAGLYRMLDEHLTMDQTFRQEMCPRGFSDGDSHKPTMVTSAIQKELTPLFIALAGKIERGEWRAGSLNKKTCANLKIAPTLLKCRP